MTADVADSCRSCCRSSRWRWCGGASSRVVPTARKPSSIWVRRRSSVATRCDGWEWRFGWGLVGAGLSALSGHRRLPRGWWWRVRQRWVLVATSLGSMGFRDAAGVDRRRDGLRYGAVHKTEYLANLATAPPAGEFVRTFVDEIDRYSVHVRGHPPGFVLVLKLLDAVGLGGVWPMVVLSIVARGHRCGGSVGGSIGGRRRVDASRSHRC